jgi:polyphenol oxidase
VGTTVPGVRLEWQTCDGVPLLFARGTGAVIAFTTRQGGVSAGDFASLNLGFATPDDAAAVAENRRRALIAAGADPARAQALRQVHSNLVLEAGPAPPGAYLAAATAWPEADALVTSQPGLPLIAHGGDCLTVALVAGDGRRLATVHAGWRGLVAGVLEAAAERVGEGFSGVIGPGAGACCYAVGPDVAAQLAERFGEDVVAGGRADLLACAQRALVGSGAAEVVNARLCTICDPEWFHSHRRNGRGSGRQAVIAYLEEERA